MSNEMVVHDASMVRPVATAQELTTAFVNYKQMQDALDKAMPDCIQEIQGKRFRKKNYWRAVKTAFNLRVECTQELRQEYPDGDWGFEVTYRATAPNGASADGDGACTLSEKSKGKMEATLHNIRSQAHTRAFNRAVSNLVGFGEVSAEEVYESRKSKPQGQSSDKPTSRIKDPSAPSTEPQQKAIHGMAKKAGIPDSELYIEINDMLRCALSESEEHMSIGSTKELTKGQAGFVIETLNQMIANKSTTTS